MKKTVSFFLGATAALLLPLATGQALAGECSNADLNRAIREVTGKEPQGQGTQGACDPSRYPIVLEKGAAPTYQQIKEKVRSVLAAPAKAATTPPAAVRTRGVTAERCFGAVGSKCDGVGFAWAASRDGNKLWVSVGSILHDNCCLANPGGYLCSGMLSAVPGMNNGGCFKEWEKARWNSLVDKRHWQHTFNFNEVPNLTWVNARQSRFQDGSSYRGYETRATAQLKAPAGTALDPGDQAFCASGRAQEYNVWGTPKRWIVCQ